MKIGPTQAFYNQEQFTVQIHQLLTCWLSAEALPCSEKDKSVEGCFLQQNVISQQQAKDSKNVEYTGSRRLHMRTY